MDGAKGWRLEGDAGYTAERYRWAETTVVRSDKAAGIKIKPRRKKGGSNKQTED
jgi:hypothetical protein